MLVVDNSSSTEVREVVGNHHGRYVDSGANVGFAAGVNRALAELGPAHGDVLLLNPDAQISTEVARSLQEAMRAHGNERVACVSPALTRDDGSQERVEWPFPTPARAWLDALGLGSVQRAPGFLIGAILLLRREAIDEVGAFDERFFLYAEETDWQQRAVRAGWSVQCCSALTARHSGAGTSSDEQARQARFHASVERYIRKWHGTAGWQVFRAAVMFGAGVRWLDTGQRALQRDRFDRYRRGPVHCAALISPPS